MSSFRTVAVSTKRLQRPVPRCFNSHLSIRGIASITSPSSNIGHTKNNNADIIIVGSGAAGLAAALRARSQGLKALIVEKASYVGGCSAYSGGGLWIPNNGIHPPGSEVEDSKEKALQYLESVIPDVGPVSSRERKMTFLENGPKMVDFLKSQGFNWVPSTGYPDYYPELPGGRAYGRSIEGDIFDLNLLGAWKPKLIPPPVARIPMHTSEAKDMTRAGKTLASIKMAGRVILARGVYGKLTGKDYVGLGPSLVGQLLHLNIKVGNDIWLDTPMKGIIIDDGVAKGIIIEKEGQRIRLNATHGVLLVAGGYAHNKVMRAKYQPSITGKWSSTPESDQGDAISAAMAIGADTALMANAWWGPTTRNPKTGEVFWEMYSRGFPHSMIVDSSGERFANEAQGYTGFGTLQLKRHETVPAIPASLIMDSRHRKKYMLGMDLPGRTSKRSIKDGLVFKADTLAELAENMGVDPTGLAKNIAKFNDMVPSGVDNDFQRGSSAYDKYFGDSDYPNTNLGTIEKGPFYGVHIWPGDLGTNGGILTDEFARALRPDGSVIDKLYAAGNSSASVMGGMYPGPGSTLGPALTFGFVAVNHIASQVVADRVASADRTGALDGVNLVTQRVAAAGAS